MEITVQTQPDTIELVAEALTGAGFGDLVVEDQAELESFLEENRACWDYIDEKLQKQLQGLCHIQLYLEDTDTASMARLKSTLAALFPRLGALNMTVKPLAQTDWSESWRENYPPLEIGSRLTVLPCWLTQQDLGDRLPVILNPGLTFGTGAHPSTHMVLEAMETLVKPGCRCLDLGSGSGVLSIAALRLGAASAVGIDIDPKAADAARENAAYNGYGAPEFTALTGDVGQMTGQYDLILVNIVADVIIRLCPALPRLMAENAVVICSGILDQRLADVTAALHSAGLCVQTTAAKEEWRCVTAKRRLL